MGVEHDSLQKISSDEPLTSRQEAVAVLREEIGLLWNILPHPEGEFSYYQFETTEGPEAFQANGISSVLTDSMFERLNYKPLEITVRPNSVSIKNPIAWVTLDTWIEWNTETKTFGNEGFRTMLIVSASDTPKTLRAKDYLNTYRSHSDTPDAIAFDSMSAKSIVRSASAFAPRF